MVGEMCKKVSIASKRFDYRIERIYIMLDLLIQKNWKWSIDNE